MRNDKIIWSNNVIGIWKCTKAERDAKRRAARDDRKVLGKGRIIYQNRNLIFLKAENYAARPMKKTRSNAAPAIRSLTEITRSLNKRSVWSDIDLIFSFLEEKEISIKRVDASHLSM